jgi:hypothetical protein
MPSDLRNQAATQADRWRDRLEAAQTTLAEAQAELSRRGDPTEPVEDWRTAFGAEQYLDAATRELTVRQEREAATRARAETATPEELDAIEADLREDLITIEAALVMVREAQERLDRARRARTRAASAVTAALDRVAAASAWQTEADKRQTLHDTWRAALGAEPLDAIVDDAAAELDTDGLAHPARDRLRELLPATLFDRAEERHGEARRRLADAAAAAASAAAVLDDVGTGRAAVDGAVGAARRRLTRAELAVGTYVRRAATRLSSAQARLASISELPDLTPRQAEALDDASSDNDDAKDAAASEAALAEALGTLWEREQEVDDAVLAAIAEDPDRDPATVDAVQDAIAARDDTAVQDPLAAARSDYDAATEHALSVWEVEVPPPLWRAARAFFDAVGDLTDLADQAARDDLGTELDAAAEALADALDEQSLADRAADDVAALARARDDELATLRATARARVGDYVRGAGPGGRTTEEV